MTVYFVFCLNRPIIHNLEIWYDLGIEVELHKSITDLYQHLTVENNAFFMDYFVFCLNRPIIHNLEIWHIYS